jgi:hypothetical protein
MSDDFYNNSIKKFVKWMTVFLTNNFYFSFLAIVLLALIMIILNQEEYVQSMGYYLFFALAVMNLMVLILQTNLTKAKQNDLKLTSNEIEKMMNRLHEKLNDFSNLPAGNKMYPPPQLSSADIGPRPEGPEELSNPSKSRFDTRISHFSAEKKLICRKALDRIIKKEMEYHNYPLEKIDEKNKRKLYLLIDSGSTVYPIFELLCNNPDFKTSFKDMEIITNNIRGISIISDFGKKSNKADPEMMYKCSVIPGLIEGTYSAIVGDPALEYWNGFLDKIIQKEENEGPAKCSNIPNIQEEDSEKLVSGRLKLERLSKDFKIIIVSLISGNYISTRDGILTRGEYHPKLKYNLIYNSHHVYVLSPLGKFFNKSAEKISDMAKNSDESFKPQKEYIKLGKKDIANLIPKELLEGRETFLVTTYRGSNKDGLYPSYLLKYFSSISTAIDENFKNNKEGDINIFREEFNPQNDSYQVVHQLTIFKDSADVLFNYEFPHSVIRNSMKKYIIDNNMYTYEKANSK